MNIDEERAKICAAARSYAGVMWRPHGRDRNGLDCAGLAIVAYRDAGGKVDEGTPDYRGIDSKRVLSILQRHCVLLNHGEQILPADFVIYGVPREGHFGVLLDGHPLNVIHCPALGKVIETRFEPKRGKIRGYYRWRQFSSPSPF